MLLRIAIFGALVATPVAAGAQALTLTVSDGRALVVGGERELGTGLSATALYATALVGAFDTLCLPDPATAGSRAEASVLALAQADVVLPASGRLAEARLGQWRSRSAALTVWTGDDTDLNRRPIAMPSRAAIVTGSYGSFKAFGAQCNLVTKVSDFAAAKGVIEALTARYGAPGKLVVKDTFADGFWTAGSVRINVNVPTTRVGAQPFHLSAQVVPAKD